MLTDPQGRARLSTRAFVTCSLASVALLALAISMVARSGTPDPTDATDPTLVTASVNSGVIVFREGLEAVLIFAAVTASFLGARRRYRKPMMIGVCAAAVATVLTWFAMQGLLHSFGAQYGDILLALTGVIAICVLLLVMNWFFHKVYWTDHIAKRNAKRRNLVRASEAEGASVQFWGFVALGFSSVYREGFEVVLFLQNLQLKSGTPAVMWGVTIGLLATVVIGLLTFVLHHKLPYKRMLVLTGILLGVVLVVMTGGSARTLVDLGWLPAADLGVTFPDWWARWFEIVPLWSTLLAQVLAAAFVIGSYYGAEWWTKKRRELATA